MISRSRPLIAFATIAAGFAFIPSSSPQAASANTTVVDVLDGDSFEAVAPNSSRPGTVQDIRMLGINSTEPGTCHADEARDWLIDRIEGKTVTLTAADPNITLGSGRPARFVDLGSADIGEEMLERGLVLPYPHPTETARNDKYLRAAAEAKGRGVGIWDDDACGSGPAQSSGLRLEVRWDAEGNDAVNPNGEWVDVFNPSSSDVNISGWHLRDASTRIDSTDGFHVFPPGSVVRAGDYIRVHIGQGTNTARNQFWGFDHPIFDNELPEAAYLFDPDGDLRASFEYPCRVDCVNEYTSLKLHVNFLADPANINGEYVDIRNLSDERVRLYGLYLESFPFAYHFEPVHSIPAGQTLRIFVGRGSDAGLSLFWGKDQHMFANAGDKASLHRKDGLELERFEWPSPGRTCTVTAPPDDSGPPVAVDRSSSLRVGDAATADARARRSVFRCP